MFTLGKKNYKLWRRAELARARMLLNLVKRVNNILNVSSTVWLSRAEREELDTKDYERPREWHEYPENSPEQLYRLAELLESLSKAAEVMRREVMEQVLEARREAKRRADANPAVQIGRMIKKRAS